MNTHRTHSTPRLLTAAAGLALALTAAPAHLLQGQATQVSAAVADSAYVREAVAMNVLEVRLGQRAEQRASNDAVKQFAKQMVAAHGTAGQQWISLAAQNRLPTTVVLSPTQQQLADRLSNLSGAEFDRAYMQAMVEDHQQAASSLQQIEAGAHLPDVKRLATSGLATTQQHLSLAQQVASQVGATGAVATTNPAPPTPTTSPAPPTSPAYPTPRTYPGAGRTDAGQAIQADGRYAQELAYGHIMEVRLAEIAQKRAKNKEVKQFANQVADDFSKWQQRWTNLASKHGGVKVNPNMGPLHREKIERLEKASNANFDQVYVSIVVENLGSMVPYMQKEGRAAKSADIRSAVNDELPDVREKLSAAQRLDRQVQAKGKAKGKGKSLSSKE